MVIAIFRSRTRPEADEEAAPLRARMQELAQSMPGYISNKSFVAADGERVSIHYWQTEEQLRAFRDHPEHKKIQRFGREKRYAEYSIYVCEILRGSRFPTTEGM
jgi:heme-degrading monooxygenase HmoA